MSHLVDLPLYVVTAVEKHQPDQALKVLILWLLRTALAHTFQTYCKYYGYDGVAVSSLSSLG
jgi:hypothetical protein